MQFLTNSMLPFGLQVVMLLLTAFATELRHRAFARRLVTGGLRMEALTAHILTIKMVWRTNAAIQCLLQAA